MKGRPNKYPFVTEFECEYCGKTYEATITRYCDYERVRVCSEECRKKRYWRRRCEGGVPMTQEQRNEKKRLARYHAIPMETEETVAKRQFKEYRQAKAAKRKAMMQRIRKIDDEYYRILRNAINIRGGDYETRAI